MTREFADDLGLSPGTLAAFARRQGWARVLGRWRFDEHRAAVVRARFAERAAAAVTSCRVDGCEVPPVTRGYCTPHYRRLQRHGGPTVGDGPGGHQSAKTHCPKGHPYDEANTVVYADGRRRCRACRKRARPRAGPQDGHD